MAAMSEIEDCETITAVPVPLRVAAWNLNHWQQPLVPEDTRAGAWAHLGTLGAQVALVQEAVPPWDLPRERAVYGEIAGHRNWGSAVVALDPAVQIEPIRSARMPWSKRRYLLDRANPGSCAVARVSVEGIQPITFVSLYGVHEASAVSSIHRAVADLLPLFDSPDGARVVLGGDLNVSAATRDPRWRARAEGALRAIESLGLVEAKTAVADRPAPSAECPCGSGEACGHIPTWKNAELDHLYVSPALAPQAHRLDADRTAPESGLSDHVPLVLDLVLSPDRTPHGWDEEAFAVEIGRRHGATARRTVEALLSWAEHRERAMAREAGVTAKVLTRFPVAGITAEPELLLTLDLQPEPRASQVLLSVRASGEVVLWFGGWKLPPFGEPANRHGLRHALNRIDGVRLRATDAYGWPRVGLATISEPASLVRLVAVLDRLADESHAAPSAGDDGPATGSAETSTMPESTTAHGGATGGEA